MSATLAPTRVAPLMSEVSIGRVIGSEVFASEDFIRYWNSVYQRIGDKSAPSNADIGLFVDGMRSELDGVEADVATVQRIMLTATYDDAHDERVLSIRNQNGAELAIDELLCWDINYWLTRDEIADTRNPHGPTIDLTAQIQFAHDQLVAKLGTTVLGTAKAGRSGAMHFHWSYLHGGLSWNTAIAIRGDNFRDTIFVQSAAPAADMFTISADNGATSGGRSPYWEGSSFSILMKGTVNAPDGTALNGISFAAPTDPLGHNSGILHLITITGASGSGAYFPSKRHGPKLRFCYFNGCGFQDQSVAQDGSGHAPNVFMGSDSDGEMLHCGSGSGKGHSVWIKDCETTQINGGDYWASSNAALDYRAIFAEGMDYITMKGFDCNGAVEYQGNGTVKSSQVRFSDINFRFFPSSFGDDDPDDPGVQPAPLDAYLILHNAMNSRSTGCTFTPYYHGQYGPVYARPRWIYKVTGVTMHHADDQLQDIASNDWPAGADAAGVLDPAPTYATTVTNDWTRLSLTARNVDSALGLGSLMLQHLRFVPDVPCGIVGRTDGTDAPTGFIGETVTVQFPSTSPVALTTATIANIGSAPLPPGSWHIYGTQVFVANAAAGISGVRGAISTNSATVPATSSVNYRRRFLSIPGPINFDFEVLEYGPIPIKVTTTTNVYSSVRADFTSGAGSVGAWGDLRAVRVG